MWYPEPKMISIKLIKIMDTGHRGVTIQYLYIIEMK